MACSHRSGSGTRTCRPGPKGDRGVLDGRLPPPRRRVATPPRRQTASPHRTDQRPPSCLVFVPSSSGASDARSNVRQSMASPAIDAAARASVRGAARSQPGQKGGNGRRGCIHVNGLEEVAVHGRGIGGRKEERTLKACELGVEAQGLPSRCAAGCQLAGTCDAPVPRGGATGAGQHGGSRARGPR